MAYALAGTAAAPVVVLQSGLGDGRTTWDRLWPLLTVRRRVFAADRPGYGDSPSTSAPRDPCHVARELHAALHEARVPPPYLLVGHSLGGLYQVVFAQLFPQETAGLLLLDPTHPDHWAVMQGETPKTAALLSGLRLDWQQRLGAPADIVSTSGHYLHRDAPERVVQALDGLWAAAIAPRQR